MNKKTKNLIIGAAAVLLLAVVMTVLLLLPKPDDGSAASSEAAPTETYPLIEANVDNFTSATVTNASGEYIIEATGKKVDDKLVYTIKELKVFTENNTLYTSAVKAFSAVTATTKVFDEVEDKAKYGLAEPSATVLLDFDGKRYTLYLGDEAAGVTGYYAMVEGDDALYVVNKTLGQTLLRSKLEYLDKQLIEGYDSKDTENIPKVASLSISRSDLETPIVLEKIEEEGVIYSSGFRMKSPVDSDVDSRVDMKYVMAFFGLRANGVAAIYDEADAAVYGFDAPTALIELAYNNLTASITVGKPTGEGDNYYVLFNDNGLVYEVSKASLLVMDVQADDMISGLGILPVITDVGEVSVNLRGKEYNFKLTHALKDPEDEDSIELKTVTCDGEELDDTEFKHYYQLLIYPQIENINTTPVDGEPSVSAVFHYLDGREESMAYYELPGRRIQISVNGEVKFEARAGYIDKLVTEMEHLLTGAEVKLEW